MPSHTASNVCGFDQYITRSGWAPDRSLYTHTNTHTHIKTHTRACIHHCRWTFTLCKIKIVLIYIYLLYAFFSGGGASWDWTWRHTTVGFRLARGCGRFFFFQTLIFKPLYTMFNCKLSCIQVSYIFTAVSGEIIKINTKGKTAHKAEHFKQFKKLRLRLILYL